MKKLIVLTYLFCLSANANLLDKARELFKQNETQKATSLLFQVNKENEDFSESSELLVKHYFKTKNYSKLFANALFYRHWLKQNPKAMNYRPKIFAIEALGLAMNCRLAEAELILKESEFFSKKHHVEKNYIARTRQQLKIGQSFPEFIANNQITTDLKSTSTIDARKIWKISSSSLDRLPNAKGLSLKLEDKCKK